MIVNLTTGSAFPNTDSWYGILIDVHSPTRLAGFNYPISPPHSPHKNAFPSLWPIVNDLFSVQKPYKS